MTQYYYHNGVEKLGPFSEDELKALPLTKDTKLSFDGSAEYKAIREFSHLANSFIDLPARNFRVSSSKSTIPKKKANESVGELDDFQLKRDSFILGVMIFWLAYSLGSQLYMFTIVRAIFKYISLAFSLIPFVCAYFISDGSKRIIAFVLATLIFLSGLYNFIY